MGLLQKLLRKPTIAPGIVAISFFQNGFTIAVCRYLESGKPHLQYCEFIPAAEQQRSSLLATLVKNRHLEDYDCHILLTADQYRTINIEAPAVPAEELKQAVSWRIADMLDFPVDQAIVDYYPMPNSNRANAPSMLEVVACNSQLMQSLSQLCKQAELRLKVIDIQETALRNLAALLPENDQGVAVLHLSQHSGHIIIQKNAEIHLSRKIDHGYARLTGDLQQDDQEQLQAELNNLALEIQRSLDYVENFYDIPPIKTLAVILMPTDSFSVINFLNLNYGITARVLDITAIIEGETLLNDSTQNICAATIGASLRRYLELAR